MRINTSSELINDDFQLITTQDHVAKEMTPRVTKDRDGNITGNKVTENGELTYSIPNLIIKQDGKKLFGDFYVSVLEPVDLPELTKVRFDGNIVINVYGKMTTILAERVVPVDDNGLPSFNLNN